MTIDMAIEQMDERLAVDVGALVSAARSGQGQEKINELMKVWAGANLGLGSTWGWDRI